MGRFVSSLTPFFLPKNLISDIILRPYSTSQAETYSLIATNSRQAIHCKLLDTIKSITNDRDSSSTYVHKAKWGVQETTNKAEIQNC